MIQDIKDYLKYLEPYQRWAFYVSSVIVGLVILSLLIAFPAVVSGILLAIIIVGAFITVISIVMDFIWENF